MCKDQDFNLPQAGKKLFIEGGGYFSFAHIGWGGTGAQFHSYIAGYKMAADSLVDWSISSKRIEVLDRVFYPICFLYRQFIELSLKEILIYYSDLDRGEIKKKLNHNLLDLWKCVKSLFLEISPEDDTMILNAESYIIEFNAVDQSSFTFRYPITKDLEGVIKREQRIDIPNLKARMNELYNFFEGSTDILSEIKTFEDELERYFQEI